MKNITSILLLVLLSVISAFAQERTSTSTTARKLTLGIINEIDSKELNEKRVINIYLPEGYADEDRATYPVIYLLDGAMDEDFLHIAGLVQFNSFEWVKRLPKSILVGIAGVDRRRDFTFPTTFEKDSQKYPTTGHSDKFIAFIENELQPFIERNYRVNRSKMIIGQSFGGLLATEILFKKPMLFDKYVIVSPSLWWDNGSLLNLKPEILSASFNRPTDIYIGVGKEGLAPFELPRVMEVDGNLLAEKIESTKSKKVKVHFDYLPLENHATALHQAVSSAFRLLYPKLGIQ